MSQGRLHGKVVLITGIGSGMGKVTAELFAQEGAHIAGCDINRAAAEATAAGISESGGTIDLTSPVNLADRSEAEAWVQKTVTKLGRIDVLYNNASSPRFAPFPQMSDEDYLFTMQHELDLVWHTTQAAWNYLVESQGVIVNVGSGAAFQGARELPQAAHAAAKGAVVALTRQLAAEGLPHGIRANSVSPGVMATPPILQAFERLGNQAPFRSIVERTLTQTPGDPIAAAYAGLYLASDESSWVTGTNLVVDGGASSIL